jgi:hypothetical protein
MEQHKQPNWLKVAVVTTIVGGVVQVIVNHFDTLVVFFGGAISHVHLSVNVVGILNVISALATVGGAVATILAYRYARSARKMRSVLKQVLKIATDELERQKTGKPVEIPPIDRWSDEQWAAISTQALDKEDTQ